MATQIPNTKMYSSLIRKELHLGINKNTNLLNKPTIFENEVAAAVVLHLTLLWLHIFCQSLLFDSQKLWILSFLFYYRTHSTGSLLFFFFFFCLDKGAQRMLGDNLVGWRRNFNIWGLGIKKQQVNIWAGQQLMADDFFWWSDLHFYSLQSRQDGSSVEG